MWARGFFFFLIDALYGFEEISFWLVNWDILPRIGVSIFKLFSYIYWNNLKNACINEILQYTQSKRERKINKQTTVEENL